MKFEEVREITNKILREEERTTVYKGPDMKIVKSANKFEAIFLDVPTDKIANNTHFPYLAGQAEGANIDKVTLLPNDIIELHFTNDRVVKITKVAVDKKGNIMLKRAVGKMLTAREKV